MAFLLRVILGIVVCAASLNAADDQAAEREALWLRDHPTIPAIPSLPSDPTEIPMLPPELAGTWWSHGQPAQVVTGRSMQTYDKNGPNKPPNTSPNPFSSVMKYKTTDGSLMVRVAFERGLRSDMVFRFIPKHGVVINIVKNDGSLSSPEYFEIQ